MNPLTLKPQHYKSPILVSIIGYYFIQVYFMRSAFLVSIVNILNIRNMISCLTECFVTAVLSMHCTVSLNHTYMKC